VARDGNLEVKKVAIQNALRYGSKRIELLFEVLINNINRGLR
jgi:hypothetical protein